MKNCTDSELLRPKEAAGIWIKCEQTSPENALDVSGLLLYMSAHYFPKERERTLWYPQHQGKGLRE